MLELVTPNVANNRIAADREAHLITHNFIYPSQVYDLTMELSDELG